MSGLICQYWSVIETSAIESGHSQSLKSSVRPLLGLLWDAGIPVLGFYTLQILGASDWAALLAATLFAGARVFWVALRTRRITWFAAMMMLVFGVGLALAFVVGDPRLMLAKNSVGALLIGVLFLASLATKRPLTLIAFQTWRPRDADALARAYHDDSAVGRVFRRSACVWGIGMILEAALRLPMIYMVPLSVSVGVSAAFSAMVIGSLAIWTAVTTARLPRWDGDAAQPDASRLTNPSIP
jgi:hypothetical protein